MVANFLVFEPNSWSLPDRYQQFHAGAVYRGDHSDVRPPPQMLDNTHGGVPSGESGQNSEHPCRGITATTNPPASHRQQHHQTVDMLKRAREDDGEDERVLSASRGMLNGSVAAAGCLGKRRSKLQLRTHPSLPSAKLTVTPPTATTATEASYAFSPPVEAQIPSHNNNGQDMDMMDGLHAPYSVIIGPPTPVSDGGEGEGDVEMKEAFDTGREREREREKRKPLFRMGYLADCEKCRLRIPGHYSHY
ncbi:hypothetical protein C7212DRAFT_365726 [Tuber magnatum]|uniref:Uncharacterized protein n=1 Tax=Tuber magnatum TaxID=42249 RepID=A0A317SIM8_9PEZI|nr:hypothetical protein C7212DRAFT_365726 [Tuber magnatum]